MENFEGLHYVQIAPKGTLVPITGRNGQGKTGLLNGIVATMLGQNKRDFPTPVHEGADHAVTELKFTNGMVGRRRFNPDASSTLTAKSADGKNIPQATINGMISAIGIDTGLFLDLDDKKQREILLKMVKLPFDPVELEAERDRVYRERTAHNAEVKRLTTQVGIFPELPADLPEDETSVADLAEEIRGIEQQASKQAADREQLEQAKKHEAAVLEQLANVRLAISKLEPWVAAHQPLPDVEDLRTKMSSAEETNRLIRSKKEKEQLEFNLALATGSATRADKRLEEIAQTKRDGLAETKFPAEGMTFDEDGVLLNGRPLRKASTGEQTEAMVEMIIASDPELKVIVIRNGNDMDSERLARIEAKGEAAGFQIWAEFVDESGDFGWVISDGKLAS